MAKIGEKTLKRTIELMEGLLRFHQLAINEAYLKADDALTVTLKAEFKPGKYSGIDIKTKIDFVAEKVKDSDSSNVNEDQMSIFDEKAKKKNIGLYIMPRHDYRQRKKAWVF